MRENKNNIVDTNNQNTLVNDNDNGSLNENACLKAIPYEQALQQNGWGELKPIDTALLPVEPFDPIQVPYVLGRYIYDVADAQQSSLDYVAVSALCGLAAVIGNGVRIAPKQHANWKIVPNLWGALIGQPSTMKTDTMQAALEPLCELEEEWHQEWVKKTKQQEIQNILSELDKRENKPTKRSKIKMRNKPTLFCHNLLNTKKVRRMTVL